MQRRTIFAETSASSAVRWRTSPYQETVRSRVSPAVTTAVSQAVPAAWESARTTPEARRALAPAMKRLAHLSTLGPNWDSYGGEAISAAAISKATELLRTVKYMISEDYLDRVLPYMIAPLSNGGVQVEWRAPGCVLEVEIDPNDRMGYLLIKGEGDNRQFDECDQATWCEVLPLVARVLVR